MLPLNLILLIAVTFSTPTGISTVEKKLALKELERKRSAYRQRTVWTSASSKTTVEVCRPDSHAIAGCAANLLVQMTTCWMNLVSPSTRTATPS